MEFRKGGIADAGRIADLVNSAYRDESSKLGWTTEADLIGGQRTDAGEVKTLIGEKDSIFILCMSGDELIASVHVERQDDHAIIGMLTVKPDLQGKGIGKRLLDEAEKRADEAWKVGKFRMAVLTFRDSLIEFYERRGYRRTGLYEPFPSDPKFGIPKVSGLRFEWLEKHVLPSR